jgi:hypothetical protein
MGNRNMDEKRKSVGTIAPEPQFCVSDAVYRAYVEYFEASKAARMQYLTLAATRRSLRAEKPDTKLEFERRLAGMEASKRENYLRSISVGYHAARIIDEDHSLEELMKSAFYRGLE